MTPFSSRRERKSGSRLGRRTDLRYCDGGHFVLDEYADPIAQAIIETFFPIARPRNY
ncbi:MAG: hypothetical protein ABSD39_06970 [Terriglobales bacterium]|jgi:hypothetical protein